MKTFEINQKKKNNEMNKNKNNLNLNYFIIINKFY